jgi:hypothetical protein
MSISLPVLLSFVEVGGYPDFTSLYRRLGFDPVVVTSGRKAQGIIRSRQPAAMVADFYPQSDFRDRTGSLESLMAAAEHLPGMRVVVLYPTEAAPALDRLRGRFSGFTALQLPVDEARLEAALRN